MRNVTATHGKRQPPGRVPALWVDAAGRIYIAGVRGRAPLDQAVAETLRALGTLDDDGRAFAVDVAQGMFRARARLEAAAATLPFSPTRHALVCLFLVGARGQSGADLPGDPRLVRDFTEAWRTTEHAAVAVRASVPAWFVEALRVERGAADGDRLALAMTEPPPTALRANRLKNDADALVDALARDRVMARRGAVAPDAVVLERRANVFRTAAFRDGLFEVQDEGSQLVSLLCGARAGMTVVDGCAGAGGKTLHLAALMEGKGTLWALDVHERRLAALTQRAARADAHNVRVHDARDAAVRARLHGAADVVLVDAPCSGTGVLRRNPDTSWRLQRADVTRMQAEQREILDGYAALVRPSGRLVYATCSLLADENEQQAEGFLARHPDFALVDAGAVLALPAPGVVDPRARFLKLDPLQDARTDGFFGAVFEKRA